jgi:hypothetical protein
MRMTKITLALAIAVGVALGGIDVAQAAPPEPNAPQLCRESNNADGFLASHGGCVSSVSTVGLDALMAGAFPSRAAVIANCKGIAADVGGFPYYFYGRVGDDRYLATNLNSCADILYLFHTGQLEPGPAAG